MELNADAPRRGVLFNALARLRSVLYLLSTYSWPGLWSGPSEWDIYFLPRP